MFRLLSYFGFQTTAAASSSGFILTDNIGFAIPINSVRDIIESIIEDGYIMKLYIGVPLYDLGNEYQRFGLTGAVVQSVEEGSPAAAGLQQNDIITKVNGTDISGRAFSWLKISEVILC